MATPRNPPEAPSPLAKARLALPDRPSQGWVADQISDRIGEVIGQQAISYWEKGRVDLRNVHPRKLRAYADVLRITPEELATLAGYAVEELFPDSSPPTDEPPTPSPRRRSLPDELAEMIEAKQHLAPELKEERWQQYLAGQRFSTGSVSAEKWWRLFLLLQSEGIEPGGN